MQHWLILKGALVSTTDYDHHKDPAAALRDVPNANDRTALLQWATEQVARSAEFRRTVLPGTLSQHKSAHLWKMSSLDDATSTYLKKLVADFAGVAHGRELRYVRELIEVLGAITNDGVDE